MSRFSEIVQCFRQTAQEIIEGISPSGSLGNTPQKQAQLAIEQKDYAVLANAVEKMASQVRVDNESQQISLLGFAGTLARESAEHAPQAIKAVQKVIRYAEPRPQTLSEAVSIILLNINKLSEPKQRLDALNVSANALAEAFEKSADSEAFKNTLIFMEKNVVEKWSQLVHVQPEGAPRIELALDTVRGARTGSVLLPEAASVAVKNMRVLPEKEWVANIRLTRLLAVRIPPEFSGGQEALQKWNKDIGWLRTPGERIDAALELLRDAAPAYGSPAAKLAMDRINAEFALMLPPLETHYTPEQIVQTAQKIIIQAPPGSDFQQYYVGELVKHVDGVKDSGLVIDAMALAASYTKTGSDYAVLAAEKWNMAVRTRAPEEQIRRAMDVLGHPESGAEIKGVASDRLLENVHLVPDISKRVSLLREAAEACAGTTGENRLVDGWANQVRELHSEQECLRALQSVNSPALRARAQDLQAGYQAKSPSSSGRIGQFFSRNKNVP